MTPHRRQPGFTLIEMMVALAVASILLAVAAPVMMSSLGVRNAQSIGSHFVQDAAWVRSQAIAGATSASITLTTSCAYSADVAGVTSAESGAHSMTAAQVESQAPGMQCAGVPANGLTVSFDALGLASIPSGQTSNAPTTVTFASPQGGASGSTVEIFGSGIMIWNPQNAS